VAAAPAPAVPAEGLKPAIARPTYRARRPLPRRPLYAAAGLVLLLGAGYWVFSGDEAAAPTPNAAPAATGRRTTAEKAGASRRDPVETGTTTPAEPPKPGPLAGVAEVVDTATLKLGGKTLRLFGIESAKGAQGDDLTAYLAGRPVACQPAAAGAYLCTVDGHDLSEVVLYNGGGRATPDATSDLLDAERHARNEKLGIWRK
jgi:endonuclease YncB( thermonuclease family)